MAAKLDVASIIPRDLARKPRRGENSLGPSSHPPVAPFGLTDVHVRRFRSLKDASFRPGAISAIVGEPSTGKSNLLTAIWALLDPDAAPPPLAEVVGRAVALARREPD